MINMPRTQLKMHYIRRLRSITDSVRELLNYNKIGERIFLFLQGSIGQYDFNIDNQSVYKIF